MPAKLGTGIGLWSNTTGKGKRLKRTIQNSEVMILLVLTAATEIILVNYLPVALCLDLPLIFALYIGWHSSLARGAVCGSMFGWIQDAILGVYLGINGFSKTLGSFGISYLSRWITMDSLLARCILVGLMSLFDDLLVMGMRTFLGQTVQQEIWLQVFLGVPVTGLVGGGFFFAYDRLQFPRKDFSQRLGNDNAHLSG
ncbi:MAG: rod shape-determining protein MreD [Acidobacteriota bacterium]|nr:rod shape-determining protein MreD [Acidobacteriota bacterium]